MRCNHCDKTVVPREWNACDYDMTVYVSHWQELSYGKSKLLLLSLYKASKLFYRIAWQIASYLPSKLHISLPFQIVRECSFAQASMSPLQLPSGRARKIASFAYGVVGRGHACEHAFWRKTKQQLYLENRREPKLHRESKKIFCWWPSAGQFIGRCGQFQVHVLIAVETTDLAMATWIPSNETNVRVFNCN